MKYEILYKANICGKECVCVCTKLANGKTWGFTLTEEQAKQRVADLATIGVAAWYEPINEEHWVNNWIG